jgi:hypothetical protein
MLFPFIGRKKKNNVVNKGSYHGSDVSECSASSETNEVSSERSRTDSITSSASKKSYSTVDSRTVTNSSWSS